MTDSVTHLETQAVTGRERQCIQAVCGETMCGSHKQADLCHSHKDQLIQLHMNPCCEHADTVCTPQMYLSAGAQLDTPTDLL